MRPLVLLQFQRRVKPPSSSIFKIPLDPTAHPLTSKSSPIIDKPLAIKVRHLFRDKARTHAALQGAEPFVPRSRFVPPIPGIDIRPSVCNTHGLLSNPTAFQIATEAYNERTLANRKKFSAPPPGSSPTSASSELPLAGIKFIIPLQWLDLTKAPSADQFEESGGLFPDGVEAIKAFSTDFEQLTDEVILRAAGYSRARSTNRKYFYAWRRWVQFATQQGYSILPAEPQQFARYLVWIAASTAKLGGVTSAIDAIGFVHRLNKLPPPKTHGPVDAVAAALKREWGKPAHQVRPLKSWMVMTIVEHYCLKRKQFSLYHWVIAMGILAGYTALGRYDDIKEMRLEPENCVFRDSHIRIFLRKRKNVAKAEGMWVDIAADPGSPTCPVRLLRQYISYVGPRGFLLRDLQHNGGLGATFGTLPHTPLWVPGNPARPLSYDAFKKALRLALKTACGFPDDIAELYATQSIRRGGATTALKHGINHSLVRTHAGVTSFDWTDRYNDPDLEQRLAPSRALYRSSSP
jgi:hypothetical protein